MTDLSSIGIFPAKTPVLKIENSTKIFSKFEELVRDTLAREKQTNGISCGDVIDYDRFVAKCPLNEKEELDKRYQLYLKIRRHKKTLLEQHGAQLFSLGFDRKWNAIELFLTLRPTAFAGTDSDWDDLQNICQIYEELACGTYSCDEVRLVLRTLFATSYFHPQLDHFNTYVQAKLLVQKVDHVASSMIVSRQVFADRPCQYDERNVWFVPNEDEPSEYSAKYTEAMNPNEIGAFRVSQLLGTSFVPLSTALPPNNKRKCFKHGGTIQKFYNRDVVTLHDFLKTKKNGAQILADIPSMYLHLYLIQAMIIGQTDGHFENTFIQLDRGQFKELLDFDNEYIMPLVNDYYGLCRGNMRAVRITLMGLKQAQNPLNRAMLFLLSSQFFGRKILSYFKNGPIRHPLEEKKYHALEERLRKIQKLCRFASEHRKYSLSCEKIFFHLFGHEDNLIIYRRNGISDLVTFGSMGIESPDEYSINRWKCRIKNYGKGNATYSGNLQYFVSPLSENLVWDDWEWFEAHGGLTLVAENLEKHLQFFSGSTQEIEVVHFDPSEIDLSLWQECQEREFDSSLLPLLLKGYAPVFVRWINRNYPILTLRLKEKKGRYLLVMQPGPEMVQVARNNAGLFQAIESWNQFEISSVDRTIEIPFRIQGSFDDHNDFINSHVEQCYQSGTWKNFLSLDFSSMKSPIVQGLVAHILNITQSPCILPCIIDGMRSLKVSLT